MLAYVDLLVFAGAVHELLVAGPETPVGVVALLVDGHLESVALGALPDLLAVVTTPTVAACRANPLAHARTHAQSSSRD